MRLQNPNAMAELARSVVALDLSEENDRIDEIEREISKFEAKITVAEARSSELSAQIRDYEGPDPSAVADALLADLSPTDAASLGATKEELRSERNSLRAGIGDLHARIREKRQEIAEVRQAASVKVTELARPIVEEICNVQIRAAEVLIETFAAIDLIHGVAERFTGEMRRSREAVNAISATDGILPYRREVEIPSDLVEALEPLASKGKALRANIKDRLVRY